MNIKISIKDFINRTFKDEIIAINPPQEYYRTYRDIGIRLEAYVVKATYKYAGEKKIFFNIDNDHFQIIPKERAFDWANNFYQCVSQRLKVQSQKTK